MTRNLQSSRPSQPQERERAFTRTNAAETKAKQKSRLRRQDSGSGGAPGARRPQIAAREVTLARWLVAEGHSVWVDVTHYPKPSTLWRFDGPNARPVFHRSLGAALDYGEFGYGEPGYAGGASGLWAVVPRSGQLVIRIDPNRGQSTRMTTIHPQPEYHTGELQPPLVVFHGAAYFLDPPAQAGTYPYRRGGFSALYRVTPSGARHAR